MMTCVSIGPGSPEFLTDRGRREIAAAEVVAGFKSVIDLIRPLIDPSATVVPMGYRDQTERLQWVAERHHEGQTCVVAFMGDLHFSGFQLLERVEQACGHAVETVPGISAAQILASRARVCFDETTFITFHRRGDLSPFQRHLVHLLRDERNAIVLPRPWDWMPKQIAAFLLDQGIPPDHPTEVWENLTLREASWQGSLKDCTDDFTDMSIMLIRSRHPMPSAIGKENLAR